MNLSFYLDKNHISYSRMALIIPDVIVPKLASWEKTTLEGLTKYFGVSHITIG